MEMSNEPVSYFLSLVHNGFSSRPIDLPNPAIYLPTYLSIVVQPILPRGLFILEYTFFPPFEFGNGKQIRDCDCFLSNSACTFSSSSLSVVCRRIGTTVVWPSIFSYPVHTTTHKNVCY